MAESVYTKVLQHAIAIEGGTHSLAGVLRVPEGTLQRWLSGRAQMPLRAFLKALELVRQRELKTGAAALPVNGAENLHLQLASCLAECDACGGTQFTPVDKSQALKYTSLLRCCACCAEAVHGDLIVRLAKEAAQRIARGSRHSSVIRKQSAGGLRRAKPKSPGGSL